MKVEQLHGPNTKPFQVSDLERLIQEDSADIFGPFGFQKGGKVIVTRAPARLDIMGGVADYCGANVFEMTLERTALAACQAREDRLLRAVTLGVGNQYLYQPTKPDFYQQRDTGNTVSLGDKQVKQGVQLSLDDFYADGKLKTYAQVRGLFNKDAQTAWSGYILGGFYALLKEGKIGRFPHGAAIVIKSDIPMGAGIASSAAIEVAALMAINQLYELNLSERDIAHIAQIVENRIVGAPCGIMDQVTTVSGKRGKVLSIRCQPMQAPRERGLHLQSPQSSAAAEAPYEILGQVSKPFYVSFVGVDTKARRSTTSTAYIDARTAAFMGLTILQKALKLETNYLCNLAVQEFHEQCEPLLPEQMRGDEFLEQYGATADTVTQVEPEKVYPVRSRVQHPVYENARVKRFIAALENARKEPEHIRAYLRKAGALMYESNASYRDLAGLGSPEVDGLVDIAQKIGEPGGIYGAKITGGGGGGTVALLCYGLMTKTLTQLLAAYKLAWGLEADIFRGSTDGAAEFGHYVWELSESEFSVVRNAFG